MPAHVTETFRKTGGGAGGPGFVLALLSLAIAIGLGLTGRLVVRRIGHGQQNAALDGTVTRREKLIDLAVCALRDFASALIFVALGFAVVTLAWSSDGYTFAFASGFVLAAALIVLAHDLSRSLLTVGRSPMRLWPLADATAAQLARDIWVLVAIGTLSWTATAYLILQGRPSLGLHLSYVLLSGAAVLTFILLMIRRYRTGVASILSAPGDDHGAWLGQPVRARLASSWHLIAGVTFVVIGLLWANSMLARQPSTLWPSLATVLLVVLVMPLDGLMRGAIHRLSESLFVDRYTRRGIAMGGEDSDDDAPIEQIEAPPLDPRYVRPLIVAGRIILVLLALSGVFMVWDIDILKAVGAPGASALLGGSV